MPNYKGHLVGGFIAYAIVVYILLYLMIIYVPSITTAIEWLLFTLAGSLFPDVDIKSKGQKLFYRTMFGITLLLILKQRFELLILVMVLSFIPLLVRHRGIFHNFWFIMMLVGTVTCTLTIYYPAHAHIITTDALFFITGIISHLWLDLGLKRMLRL